MAQVGPYIAKVYNEYCVQRHLTNHMQCHQVLEKSGLKFTVVMPSLLVVVALIGSLDAVSANTSAGLSAKHACAAVMALI